MNYLNQEPKYFFIGILVVFLLFSCNNTHQTPTNNDQPAKGTTVNQTATTNQQTTTTTNQQQTYCEGIEYRYFTRDIQPFTSNPCPHPISPKCYWNQVRFHISGPGSNAYKLTKITIDEGAHLTFGNCKNCRPNGEPKITNDKPDWLTICDGNEQTGVLSIEVKSTETGEVLGVCEKPFSFKVTPPCPAGR